MHKRLHPRGHRFSYRVVFLCCDIDEPTGRPGLLRLLSHNRFNLFSFFDGDRLIYF